MADVSIKGVDKVKLVKALYNRARPQGMGWMHATIEPLTMEVLEDMAKAPWLDYVFGRVMKLSVAEDTMRVDLYNRDNGPGAAEGVLAMVKGVDDD